MELKVSYRSELELLTCEYSTNLEIKYRVFQVYGQKYVKLLNPITDPKPKTEIFASNIPRNIAIEKLFHFFAKCGEIYQIRLLMDFSGYNRGKCFVQYKEVRACREAICCLHDEDIDLGHKVVVKLSLNNNQLILKSIPEWISDDFIKDVLRRTIGEGLTAVVVKKSRVPYKNYCFCTYRDHQFAIMAHKKSWPFINIAGMVIDVHWAVPKLLRYSANLYFTNFSQDMTKNEFFEVLTGVIDVSSLVQFRIANFCGFITFFNNLLLTQAEQALKGLTIKGFTMKFSRLPFRNTSTEYYKHSVRSALPSLHSSFSYCGCYQVPNQPCLCSYNVPYLMPQTSIPPVPFYNGGYATV